MSTAPQLDIDAQFHQIVDELTRRGFLSGALGAAGFVALSACGDKEGSAKAGPSTRVVSTPIGWADLCTYRWAGAALSDFSAVLNRYSA